MILDALNLFSGAVSPASNALTGQAVSGAGNVLGTNTIDVGPLALGGNQPTNIGSGEQLTVVFNVLSAPSAGTSVQFQLIQADDPAITSNVQVVGQSDAIPIASLPAGTAVYVRPVPIGGYAPKRYLSVRYVNVGAVAGLSVTAAIVKDVQQLANLYFKSGFAIQ